MSDRCIISLDCDRRDTYEGFWRAEITLTNGSVLKVREFVSVEAGIDRDMYAYQHQRWVKCLRRFDRLGIG